MRTSQNTLNLQLAYCSHADLTEFLYKAQWILVSTACYAITQVWPHVHHQLQACSMQQASCRLTFKSDVVTET